jgi:hypothetical protein
MPQYRIKKYCIFCDKLCLTSQLFFKHKESRYHQRKKMANTELYMILLQSEFITSEQKSALMQKLFASTMQSFGNISDVKYVF